MKKKKDLTSKIKSHVKCVSALIVAYGVGEIMGNVIKDFKPDAKGVRKVFIKIGALALTGMVIKSVNDYVDGEIDEVFELAEDVSIKIEEERIEEESDESGDDE